MVYHNFITKQNIKLIIEIVMINVNEILVVVNNIYLLVVVMQIIYIKDTINLKTLKNDQNKT